LAVYVLCKVSLKGRIVSAYLDIISSIFDASEGESKNCNRILAFTSSTPEAGVTYVVGTFAEKLASATNLNVLIVDARALHDLHQRDVSQALRHCAPTLIDNLKFLPALETVEQSSGEKTERLTGWHSNPQIRQAYLNRLSQHFDYVVIDCPAMSASSDLNALASMIDGVVVVVDANRTVYLNRQGSQELVESAGGKVLGYILNRRPTNGSDWPSVIEN
jgi:Mrp family chromosome partitioning ATPase